MSDRTETFYIAFIMGILLGYIVSMRDVQILINVAEWFGHLTKDRRFHRGLNEGVVSDVILDGTQVMA